MELRRIGEFGLIEKIARIAGGGFSDVIAGIGDDAAVLRISTKKCLLVTTDTLIEGIHFQSSYTTPFLLGKKSIAVNLSDIAAMGGTPFCFVASLSIPPHTPYQFIHQLYQGMISSARAFGASLVGGDTTRCPQRVVISITLLGVTEPDRVIYRHGARPGDGIYVTGFIGDAALGLALIKQRKKSARFRSLIEKQINPTPRIREGTTISRMRLASSMIDISDGLVGDLRHIIKQSHTGARIWLNRLPLSPLYQQHWRDGARQRYELALSGGDDYELLFTVPPDRQHRITELQRACGIPITCIGEITARKGRITVFDDQNKEMTCRQEGFTHF